MTTNRDGERVVLRTQESPHSMEYATPLTIEETLYLLGQLDRDDSEIGRAVQQKLNWNREREAKDKANGTEKT